MYVCVSVSRVQMHLARALSLSLSLSVPLSPFFLSVCVHACVCACARKYVCVFIRGLAVLAATLRINLNINGLSLPPSLPLSLSDPCASTCLYFTHGLAVSKRQH